jgi:imidazoleglycerol-phosphate dehydratase / histidinol-phosphatase
MNKVLFIDRDGTIINEPADEQIDSLEKLEFLPGAITNLAKIAREMDYLLVLVTNQDGLGTASFPEETFWPAHNKMLGILEGEHVVFDDIRIDRTFPHQNAPTRKPGTAMLTSYLSGKYDLKNSFVIGDRVSDIQLAENLGSQSIFIGKQNEFPVAQNVENWNEIYQLLKKEARKANVFRSTSETNIAIEIGLDGTGQSEISTGLPFFDHMLEQLSRHGNIDLSILAKGDLQIDEHHTIEDVAITLGQAFNAALGKKAGISRYGFVLPMDDCLAQVAIDFGGRPWLVWDAEFNREKIGELPTEMFFHFFKSFADNAKCNLNIKAEGENEHHKIEAIFKAFAKAIKMAVAQTGGSTIPSSKGVL